MKSMWKATLAFLVMILLLTGGGLVAGKYVFAPWERLLSDSNQGVASAPLPDSRPAASDLTDKEYKKIRLAFNSFDLAAGLTKSDLEAMPACNTYYFAFAWLCIGSMFILTKPRRKKRG